MTFVTINESKLFSGSNTFYVVSFDLLHFLYILKRHDRNVVYEVLFFVFFGFLFFVEKDLY